MHGSTKLAAVLCLRLAACASITVDLAKTYQTMDGFGFSQAFGRAGEFQALAAEPQKQGLDLLFDTSVGAGMTIIRNRIGSGNYTGDSILPKSPGSPDAEPNYIWDDDDKGQVWFSQQAMQYGVKTIYADAWSAPGFMKTNGLETNGGYLCGTDGHDCESGDWRQAYANFLVKYVQFYKDAGIQVTHLGFLNEPDFTTNYSSMLITTDKPVEVTSFVPTLHKTLQAAGLDSVTIACCDAISWKVTKKIVAALAAADSIRPYIGLLTSHMYADDPDSPVSTTEADLPPVWQTEGADLKSRWCTTWYESGALCEGLTWAGKIATGVLDANLAAYIYWQGLEIDEPQAASYLVAVLDGKTATPSGRLWAFAMWSRFVRPGAVRVGVSGEVAGVAVGAFKNTDDSVVVVLTNTGADAAAPTLAFKGFTPAEAEAYLTDNDNSVEETCAELADGAVRLSVPPHSVVTVKLTA